jgi:hypothetical protein
MLSPFGIVLPREHRMDEETVLFASLWFAGKAGDRFSRAIFLSDENFVREC